MGELRFGLDRGALNQLAEDIRQVHSMGVEICLVVGAGNIFRGLGGAAAGIERSTADGMGMLATVINALGIQSTLESMGVQTRVQSAIRMDAICEPYKKAGSSTLGKRSSGNFCCRDRKPLFYHRYSCSSEGSRNGV